MFDPKLVGFILSLWLAMPHFHKNWLIEYSDFAHFLRIGKNLKIPSENKPPFKQLNCWAALRTIKTYPKWFKKLFRFWKTNLLPRFTIMLIITSIITLFSRVLNRWKFGMLLMLSGRIILKMERKIESIRPIILNLENLEKSQLCIYMHHYRIYTHQFYRIQTCL